MEKEETYYNRKPGGIIGILESSRFLALRVGVFVISLVGLAIYRPLNDENGEPIVNKGLNLFVDVFYCVEFILYVISKNGKIATLDVYKLADYAVFLVCLLDIIFFIIMTFQKSDFMDHQTNRIEIIRSIRLLKGIYALNLLPKSGTRESARRMAFEVGLNITVPILVMIAFALMTNSWIGDTLSRRCVPESAAVAVAAGDEYYLNYGLAYYASVYNNAFCRSSDQCDTGFICSKTIKAYTGVAGAFDTPWKAFVTNTAFLTMRGWPNIFWNLRLALGRNNAIVILLILLGVGSLLVFNMVIAIFVKVLKEIDIRREKYFWLQHYPGNLSTATELDLILWAKRNYRLLVHVLFVQKPKRSVRAVVDGLYGLVYSEAANRQRQLARVKDDAAEKRFEEEEENFAEILETKDEKVALYRTRHEKITFLSPAWAPAKFLRRQHARQRSLFNLTILGLLVVDLLLFAMNFRRVNRTVQVAIGLGNAILCYLFLAELLLLLLAYGPVRFWNSLYNCYETALILLALASLHHSGSSHVPSSLASLVPYANIFRLTRIIRSSRRGVGAAPGTDPQQQQHQGYKKINSIASFFEHWLLILNESFEVFFVYFILLSLGTYLFAVLGMRIFPTYVDVSSVSSAVVKSDDFNGIALPLIHIELPWAKALPFYTYNDFSFAYVTSFSLGYLNSWFETMVLYIKLTNDDTNFFYFFPWVFVVNYMVAPLLIARILAVIDKHVALSVRNQVDVNVNVMHRLIVLRNKVRIHRYFQRFKKVMRDQGAGEAEAGAAEASGGGGAAGVVNRVEEMAGLDEEGEETWWRKQRRKRARYSLYLFPEGYSTGNNNQRDEDYDKLGDALQQQTKNKTFFLRDFLHGLIHGRLFSLLVLVAIILAITDIASSDGLSASAGFTIEVLYGFVFFLEMGLRWIVYGLVIYPEGYLYRYIDLQDLVLNGILLFTMLTNDRKLLLPFSILRIFKMPFLVDKALGGQSFHRLAKAIRRSFRSILVLSCLSLFICFVLAVFGMQLFRYGMHYCETSLNRYGFDYPADLSLYANTTIFPQGCAGYNAYYDSNLVWTAGTDTFDDIFAASASIFRVMIMNNWGWLLILSLGTTGTSEDLRQPHFGQSTPLLLFYILCALVATVLNVMFACIIYYHYQISVLTDGRDMILNQDNITMNEIKSFLKFVKPYSEVSAPRLQKSFFLRHYLYKLARSKSYNLLSAAAAFVPALCMLAFYPQTYGHIWMLYLDALYSALYCLEYLNRLYVYGTRRYLASLAGRQEFCVTVFLAVQIVVVGYVYRTSLEENSTYSRSVVDFAYGLTAVVLILRFNRLTWIFPSFSQIVRVFCTSLVGFVPMFSFILCLVLLFAVIGHYCFSGTLFFYDPYQFGSSYAFYRDNYNFATVFNAYFLLLAMATGNLWSEVIDAMKHDQPTFVDVLLSFYFLLFAVLVNTALRSFVILLISKLLEQNGINAAYAKQQLRDFRRAWRLTATPGSNTVNHLDLFRLLYALRPPLLPTTAIIGGKSYATIHRMVLKIRDAVDRTEQEEEVLFDDEEEEDEGDKDKEGADKKKEGEEEEENDQRMTKKMRKRLTFTEVLVALHRILIYGHHLPDEESFESRRAVALDIKLLSRFHLANYATDYVLASQKHDITLTSTRRAMHRLQMMQRFDRSLYQETFLRLITNTLHFTRQSIMSFDLSAADAFVIRYLRQAVRNELRSARLQFAKCDMWAKATSNDANILRKLEDAGYFFRHLVQLAAGFDELHRRYVRSAWEPGPLFELKKLELGEAGQAVPVTALCLNPDNTELLIAQPAATNGKKSSKKKQEVRISEWRILSAKKKGAGEAGGIGGGEGEGTGGGEGLGCVLWSYMLLAASEVRAMTFTSDQQFLYIAADVFLVVYGRKKPLTAGQLLKQKQNKKSIDKKNRTYKELYRIPFHTGLVTTLLPYSRQIISSAEDAQLAVWNSNTALPSVKTLLPVPAYCLALLQMDGSGQMLSEVELKDVLVAGLRNGRIVALAMTSARQSTWHSKSFENQAKGALPVTALAAAWGYLYAGAADGTVTVHAYYLIDSETTNNNKAGASSAAAVAPPAATSTWSAFFAGPVHPIQRFQLVRLKVIPCHAAAVSGLVSTGGTLCSLSFDYSILRWQPPDRPAVRLAAEFQQELGQGHVFHAAHIISSACNDAILATGDDLGNVVLSGPSRREEVIPTKPGQGQGPGSSSSQLAVREKVFFSFVEHDFKECFIPYKDIVLEEHVHLNVINTSDAAITLRCASRQPNIFALGYDEGILQTCGGRVIDLAQSHRGPGVHHVKAVWLPPQTSAQFKVTFSPKEILVKYHCLLEFLVDEADSIFVTMRGTGIKPLVKIEGSQLIDFEYTSVGEKIVRRIVLENLTPRDFVLSFTDGTATTGDAFALRDRHVTVWPQCLVIPQMSSREVVVTYHPLVAMAVKDYPLRFYVQGVPYKVATIRSRAQVRNQVQVRNDGEGEGEGEGGEDGGGRESRRMSQAESLSTAWQLFNQSKAGLSLPHGHLLLNYNEVVALPAVINYRLAYHGWHIACDASVPCLDLAVVQHAPTGLFVEIIGKRYGAQAGRDGGLGGGGVGGGGAAAKAGHSNSHLAGNSVVLDIRCEYDAYYEVYFEHMLLHCGEVGKHQLKAVEISARDIHTMQTKDLEIAIKENLRLEDVPKRDFFGAVTLEVFIWQLHHEHHHHHHHHHHKGGGGGNKAGGGGQPSADHPIIPPMSTRVAVADDGGGKVGEGAVGGAGVSSKKSNGGPANLLPRRRASAKKLNEAAARAASSGEPRAIHPNRHHPAKPLDYEAGLVSHAHAVIAKGIRLRALQQPGTGGSPAGRRYVTEDRLDVVGIHHVTSYAADGSISLFERFDQAFVENTKHTSTSSIFGDFRLSIAPYEDSTYCDVEEITQEVGYATAQLHQQRQQGASSAKSQASQGQDKVKEKEGFRLVRKERKYFLVTGSMAEDEQPTRGSVLLVFEKPTLPPHLLGSPILLRTVVVTFYKDEIVDYEAGTMRQVVVHRSQRFVHTIHYDVDVTASTAMKRAGHGSPLLAVPPTLLVSGAISTHYMNSALPLSIHSKENSLALRMNTRGLSGGSTAYIHSLTHLQHLIRGGFGNDLRSSFLFADQEWCFILRGSLLRLVEVTELPEPTTPSPAAALASPTATIKAPAPVVDLEHPGMEISFLNQGLVAKFQNNLHDEDAEDHSAEVRRPLSFSATPRRRRLVSPAVISPAQRLQQQLVEQEERERWLHEEQHRFCLFQSSGLTFNASWSHLVYGQYGGHQQRVVGLANLTGETNWLEREPAFLAQMTQLTATDSLLKKIKVALRRLVEKPEYLLFDVATTAAETGKGSKGKGGGGGGGMGAAGDEDQQHHHRLVTATVEGENEDAAFQRQTSLMTYERVYKVLVQETNAFYEQTKRQLRLQTEEAEAAASASFGAPSALLTATTTPRSSKSPRKAAMTPRAAAALAVAVETSAKHGKKGGTGGSMGADQSSKEKAKSAAAALASAPQTVSSSRLHTVRLHHYLSNLPLPGWDRPLSTAELALLISSDDHHRNRGQKAASKKKREQEQLAAEQRQRQQESVHDGLIHAADREARIKPLVCDELGTIAATTFIGWCLENPLQATLGSLTDRTVFAKLLEEEFDYVLAWRADTLRSEIDRSRRGHGHHGGRHGHSHHRHHATSGRRKRPIQPMSSNRFLPLSLSQGYLTATAAATAAAASAKGGGGNTAAATAPPGTASGMLSTAMSLPPAFSEVIGAGSHRSSRIQPLSEHAKFDALKAQMSLTRLAFLPVTEDLHPHDAETPRFLNAGTAAGLAGAMTRARGFEREKAADRGDEEGGGGGGGQGEQLPAAGKKRGIFGDILSRLGLGKAKAKYAAAGGEDEEEEDQLQHRAAMFPPLAREPRQADQTQSLSQQDIEKKRIEHSLRTLGRLPDSDDEDSEGEEKEEKEDDEGGGEEGDGDEDRDIAASWSKRGGKGPGGGGEGEQPLKPGQEEADQLHDDDDEEESKIADDEEAAGEAEDDDGSGLGGGGGGGYGLAMSSSQSTSSRGSSSVSIVLSRLAAHKSSLPSPAVASRSQAMAGISTKASKAPPPPPPPSLQQAAATAAASSSKQSLAGQTKAAAAAVIVQREEKPDSDDDEGGEEDEEESKLSAFLPPPLPPSGPQKKQRQRQVDPEYHEIYGKQREAIDDDGNEEEEKSQASSALPANSSIASSSQVLGDFWTTRRQVTVDNKQRKQQEEAAAKDKTKRIQRSVYFGL